MKGTAFLAGLKLLALTLALFTFIAASASISLAASDFSITPYEVDVTGDGYVLHVQNTGDHPSSVWLGAYMAIFGDPVGVEAGTTNGYALRGIEMGSGYGVYGQSVSGIGVYGFSPSGYAGWFDGDVNVNGNVSAVSFNGAFSGNGSNVTNVNAETLNGQSSTEIITAATDGVRTPISSLPFTISSSGPYYLTGNLTATTNGIIVTVDNVTIDFNGFTITGGTGVGVDVSGKKNVEIKNGTIAGFGQYGILDFPPAGEGHKIINMTVRNNGGTTNHGIALPGSSNLIRDCVVTGNGSAGIYTGFYSIIMNNIVNSNRGHGIWALDGSVIIGNTANNNGNHGILASGGASIKNNAASSNQWYGICPIFNSLVDGNTAFSNNLAGGYGNICFCATCSTGHNYGP